MSLAQIKEVVGRGVYVPGDDIDTDQIIPARFLSTTERAGLGKHAFNDWRWQADGSPNPDFAFNRPENAGRAGPSQPSAQRDGFSPACRASGLSASARLVTATR
jgi:hypothetical protein